jgi:hypothetical protein
MLPANTGHRSLYQIFELGVSICRNAPVMEFVAVEVKLPVHPGRQYLTSRPEASVDLSQRSVSS